MQKLSFDTVGTLQVGRLANRKENYSIINNQSVDQDAEQSAENLSCEEQTINFPILESNVVDDPMRGWLFLFSGTILRHWLLHSCTSVLKRGSFRNRTSPKQPTSHPWSKMTLPDDTTLPENGFYVLVTGANR